MKKLNPLKTNNKFYQFAVVDTETWGLGGKLAFGIIYINDKNKFEFRSKEQFYEIIKANKIETIYAHNMEFDCIKIRDCACYLELMEGTQPIYAGGLLLKIIDNTGLIWLNSLALLKNSVDELGQSLGLKKLKTPEKYINPEKHHKIISNKDIKYCIRDCKIIKEYLEKIFEFTGKQCLTIASSAMYLFRNKFLKRSYWNNEELSRYFRESYYGGRVECFSFGKQDANVYDINSLYPYVMRNIKLPNFSRLKYCDNITIDKLKTYINNFYGMANVTIKINNDYLGYLPYKINGKLSFPVGTLTGSYNFNELKFCIENGCEILNVNYVCYSVDCIENFFTDYIDYLYKIKKENDGAERAIAKYFLNSLYGKFGQHKADEVFYLNQYEFDKKILELIATGEQYNAQALKSNLYYLSITKEKERVFTIYPVASYITSAARLELLKGLINNKENVCYCDTDSIALNAPPRGIKVGKELGQWKLETYKIINIYGNKFYKTDSGIKLKGVPKRAILYGKKFQYLKLIKSKESMRTGATAGSTIITSKSISFDYDKRIKKGNKSLPIKI